jgi:hypothetical protein
MATQYQEQTGNAGKIASGAPALAFATVVVELARWFRPSLIVTECMRKRWSSFLSNCLEKCGNGFQIARWLVQCPVESRVLANAWQRIASARNPSIDAPRGSYIGQRKRSCLFTIRLRMLQSGINALETICDLPLI